MLLLLSQICLHIFDYTTSERENVTEVLYKMNPYEELRLYFKPAHEIVFVEWPSEVSISYTVGESFGQSVYGPYDDRDNVQSFCGNKKQTLNIENSEDSSKQLLLQIRKDSLCPDSPVSFTDSEGGGNFYLATLLPASAILEMFICLQLYMNCCVGSYNLCTYLGDYSQRVGDEMSDQSGF